MADGPRCRGRLGGYGHRLRKGLNIHRSAYSLPAVTGILVAMVAASLLVPACLLAQPSRLSLDVAGGLNVPGGDAAQVAGSSVAVTIGLVHRVDRRIALITDVQLAGFAGGPIQERVGTTDISTFRWTLGLEVGLLTPPTAWQVDARVTGGISTIVTDPFFDLSRPRGLGKINEDVFVLSGGLQVGRALGSLTPFVRVQPDIYFLGSDLGQLRPLNDDVGESGVLIGVPIQLGLRIGF